MASDGRSAHYWYVKMFIVLHPLLFCLTNTNLLAGKVKTIGVSNFSIKTLEQLLPHAKVVPAVNQVELHPALPQYDLKAYCDAKGILLTAYSPFGETNSIKQIVLILSMIVNRAFLAYVTGQPDPNNMALLKDSTVSEIASKTGSSVGQVLVSWAVQRGTAVVPKSEKEERIKQNITVRIS